MITYGALMASTPDRGGYLHLLPMELMANMTVVSCEASMLPWGSPSYVGVTGTDPAGDPMMVIAYECPGPWLRTFEAISQFELEWMHVHRFRSDFMFATGLHPFHRVRQGDDPPDVLVDNADRTLGLECTRLAIERRQASHGLFQNVRARVASIPPEQFASLRGQVVYLWFNDEDSALSQPFRKGDDAAAQTLVEALIDYTPDPDQLWVGATGPLPTNPEPKLARTDAGAAFYCVPMVGAVPDSPLFATAGFELQFAYSTSHTPRDEWALLSVRIQAKDRPGSDWLLISAGAPDNRGVTYPGEEALARFLRDNPIPSDELRLQNLKRVTLHLWSTGEAFDIWPEAQPLFGPLFTSVEPAHRALPPASPLT